MRVMIWCLAGSLAFVALYLVVFQLRRLERWMRREPMPTDRVWAFVVACAVLGATTGAIGAAFVTKVEPCKLDHRPIAACVLPKADLR